MATTTTTGPDGNDDTNKKRKLIDSSFEAEPIKPEWLELPEELKGIDFETDDISWNKYAPFSQNPPPIVSVDTPPTFTKESPALCFQLNGICGRARAGTLHFPNSAPPVPTPRFMPVEPKELSRVYCQKKFKIVTVP